MRVHHRCFTILAAAVLLLASSLAPSPALAQQAPTPPAPGGPFGMSMPEWQGLSCLWGGSLGAMGVFYYSDVLAVAATGVTTRCCWCRWSPPVFSAAAASAPPAPPAWAGCSAKANLGQTAGGARLGL